ncbi:hypothetical protein GC177_07290 [bacterium]|nr:hypothetical protein [bacterium]
MQIILLVIIIIFAISWLMARIAKGQESFGDKWKEYGVMAAALVGSFIMFRLGQTPVGSLLLFIFFFSPFAPYVRRFFLPEASRPSSPPAARHDVSKAEALNILGLEEGATPQQIRAAHKRLIAKNHPDQGGSAHLAAQINRARDVLLGK